MNNTYNAEKRHTFHHLNMPHLDHKFKEFDVSTYMVENKVLKGGARALYHGIRSVAIAIEMVAFALFSALKLTAKAVAFVFISAKNVVVLFVKSPFVVQQRFFPSRASVVDKKVESLDKNLASLHRLSHEEKKEVMLKWLDKTLGNERKIAPLNEVYDLMGQIANGNLSENRLVEAEKRIKAIFKDDTDDADDADDANKALIKSFPRLKLVVNTFIEVFKQERKFVTEISVDSIQKDLTILLKHPNLLKREDVESVIDSAPKALKAQIIRKKNEVLSQALADAHKEEEKQIKLFEGLKRFDGDSLKKEYISQTELNYLNERIPFVNARLDTFKDETEKSFEHYFLEFELKVLEAEKKKSDDAVATVNTLNVDDANKAIENHATALKAAVTERMSELFSADPEKSKTLKTKFEKLSQKSWEEFFKGIKPLYNELQTLEKGIMTPSYLTKINESLIEYATHTDKMSVVEELAEPWKSLNSQVPVAQRELERKNELAKAAICLAMEKKPECQLPLLVSKNDARSLLSKKKDDVTFRSSDEKELIEKAAQKFVTAVQTKHLKTFKAHLLSFTEFGAHLGGGDQLAAIDPVTKEQQEKQRLDFAKLARDIDLTEELQTWHGDLQEIWVNHMLEDQEVDIAASAHPKEKMAELFNVWLETITGRRITKPLFFDKIHAPNDSLKREEMISKALIHNKTFQEGKWVNHKGLIDDETFKSQEYKDKHPGFQNFIAKIKEKIAKRKPTEKTADPLTKELIAQEKVTGSLVTTEWSQLYKNNIEGTATVVKDFISILEEARKKIDPFSSEEWIKVLNQDLLKEAPPVRSMIIAECFDMVNKDPTGISEEIKDIFLKQFETFETMNNEERQLFFQLFLKMFFVDPVTITESERSHLIQMLSLSALPLDDKQRILNLITVDPTSSNAKLSHLLKEIGKKLQDSPISFEGLEESTLQKTFQESGLDETPEIRSLLDAMRAVSGENLTYDLLNYVYDEYDIYQYQGREAIARALVQAHVAKPDETITFIKQKIVYHQADQFHEMTLASPAQIFYQDLLCTLDPTEARGDVQFNQDLIESKRANNMLLGFAREIVALSKQDTLSDEEFYQLLKCKVAYQNIKLNYFEGKKKITGFLKSATDAAEIAMLRSHEKIQIQLKDNDFLDRLTVLMQGDKGDTQAGKILQREIANTKGQTLSQTELPGLVSLGVRIKIDGVTGIVYNDGRQQVNLSPHLQNHPAVVSLGIQHLPYTWDVASQSFIYYTKEEGVSVPQITVKEIDYAPVIQKKLKTNFQTDEQQELQFVQKETLDLPIGALHRLNVKSFWQNSQGTLFGYDKEGNLVVSLIRGNPYTVKTEDGTYTFKDPATENSSAFQELTNHFNPNEILVGSDAYLIPSLNLKLVKENGLFVTDRKGMGRKALDTSSKTFPCLTFKNEPNEQKEKTLKRELKEAKYRLELDKKDVVGPSHLRLNNFQTQQKNISRLQEELRTLEGRTFLATLPDDAYNKNKVKEILDMIPAGIKPEFNDSGLIYPYDAYHNALKFLSTKLSEAAAIFSENPEDVNASLQEQVIIWLKAYQKIQAECEKSCDKSLEAVLFTESREGTIVTNDLTGALAIALKGVEKGVDSSRLIKELAKYPFEKPLTESQINLIQQLMDSRLSHELSLYLHLMQYLHLSYKVRDLSHAPLSDKTTQIQELTSLFVASRQTCEDSLTNSTESFSGPLLSLWRKTGLLPESKALKEVDFTEKAVTETKKRVIVEEFNYFGSKTLLERVNGVEGVVATHKDPKVELSDHHKHLIRSFKGHSPDQVIGFYLEEMGHFNLDGLYSEFRVKGDKGLHGLKKEDVKDIFKLLYENKYISQIPGTRYYHVTSIDKATSAFPKNELRALLTDRALSEEQLTHITSRVQSFLFRAMQSGFKLTFKKGVEKEIDQKLETERQIHLQKMLDAEAHLKQYPGSFVDLKYALLSGDYTKFKDMDDKTLMRLNNAMITYLFHKTEIQHIENVQKAPTFGERNKIELLQTKRNYPVDLLLKEGLTGEKRKEQIMQRAFLAFEEDYGNRCNVLQIKMFRSLILDTDHEEAIDAAQARMGFGKTALLPLMSLVRIALERTAKEEDKHLVRYVVPRAVIEDNTSAFNQRLVAILGTNVVKDRDFPRYQIDAKEPGKSFGYIIQDLTARLTFYKDAKKRGNVLIQWPEIRGAMEAQELDFGQMIVEGKLSEDVLKLCVEAKKLLGQIRSIPSYTVFDELDDTQDIKSREVNFTRGEKKPIPKSSVLPLEQLITYVEKNPSKDIKTMAKNMVEALCKDRNGDAINNCPSEVIKYLTDRNCKINQETKDYLSQPLVEALDGNRLPGEHTENDSMFFLIRSLLLDPNILDLIKSRLPGTHFGTRFVEGEKGRIYDWDKDSEAHLLIAVPYEGANTPKGLSIFDNTEVAAITTMRYYRSKNTAFEVKPHLDFLIKQVEKGRLPKELCDEYKSEDVIKDLSEIAVMLDPEELRVAKGRFYQKYMRLPTEDFRKFFAMSVVLTQIRSDEACAKSDRYENGSTQNIGKGCSGTVGGTSSYFAKQETDAAADGKLSIEIMGRENNKEIKWLEPLDDSKEYLDETIRVLLKSANDTTRAIVDAAGLCKSRDGLPETVVKELWTQLSKDAKFKGVEGIVYYGKDNVKRLFRPGKEAIRCTTAMELAALDGMKYFSFYGQKNTRGSDIKQANGAHSLVTLDENVSNSDAKQAVLRFRNLVNRDSQQTFSFAVLPGFEAILKKTLHDNSKKMKASLQRDLTALKGKSDLDRKEEANDINRQIEAIDKRLEKIEKESKTFKTREISDFLRIQEKNIEEKGALMIFRKEMKAHVKQAAAHLESSLLSQIDVLTDDQQAAYIDFLKGRKNIVDFVEMSINTLYGKYGIPTDEKERDAYIEAETLKANQKIDALFVLAQQFADGIGKTVTLQKEFYQEHIERSAEIFKGRFGQDTKVQVSHIDADGQAVAEAQAMAEAQAEAVAQAEKLAEALIEVLERNHLPIVNMSNEPHIEIDFAFLDDSRALKGVEEFAKMKDLIRPEHRGKFKMSPGLADHQLLASQFVLVRGDEAIFLSQQEADAFSKLDDADKKGYQLFDARTSLGASDLATQAYCACLGDNNLPDEVNTTQDLRDSEILNVEPSQLLPKMSITGPNDLGDYFTQGAFGVGQVMPFSFQITSEKSGDKSDFKIEVQVDGKLEAVTLSQKNKVLQKAINDAYKGSVAPKKANIILDDLETQYNRIKGELDALEKEKKEIERLNIEAMRIIGGFPGFTLTQEMKNGMLERDVEKKFSFYRGDPGEYTFGRIGENTIAHMSLIENIQRNLKSNPSRQTLDQLEAAFKKLVGKETIETAKNLGSVYYKSTPLFDDTNDLWLNEYKDLSAVPFIEQNYGRIVHKVHEGSVNSASSCTRRDCQQMFATVIPTIINAVDSLNGIIQKVREQDIKIAEVEAKIKALQSKYAPLIEAREIAQKLVKGQKTIEQNLKGKGVYFNEGEYFDQFHLPQYAAWNGLAKVDFKTDLPNYVEVVNSMKGYYSKALKSFTKDEKTEYEKNVNLLKRTLELAKRVENREGEVELHLV